MFLSLNLKIFPLWGNVDPSSEKFPSLNSIGILETVDKTSLSLVTACQEICLLLNLNLFTFFVNFDWLVGFD